MLMVAVLAGPGLAAGQVGEYGALFVNVSEAESGADSLAGNQDFIRRRPVLVNLDSMGRRDGSGKQAGRALKLNLFADAVFTAIPDQVISKSPGKLLWHGSVLGVANSTVTIAVHGAAASGTFWIDEQLYKLASIPDGRQVINEVNPAEPLPEMQPIPVDAPPKESGRSEGDEYYSAEADDGSIIDVLVVYTPAARNAVGGDSQMFTLIDLAVAETNQAYINSQVRTQLHLVHAAEVNYAESGDFTTDLTRLTSKTDGFMDQVHTLRDNYGADVVSLLINDNQYCGIAWLMRSLSSGFEAYAFSVVYRKCATGYYSFGHEIGHNQGSHHDRKNANSPGLFEFSYGYQAPDKAFRTIMAYNCSSDCTRVPYFSNPSVSYGGQPTGIGFDIDPSNSADNARSINDSRFVVANWRVSSPPLPDPPLTPGNLAANTASFHEIRLTWQNYADNADGIAVERRPEGGSWQTIAQIAPDQSSYNNFGLAEQSSYFYRVRAYNLGGYSGYSNEASATTLPAPYSFFLPMLVRE
jgi:hypothetical protein